jgi:prepilin-type processing-associated H-X9-DG protein
VVELLVVVAVAAMLTALMIPALAGAKLDSYRAWCAANQRQIGTAFRLFENDHGDMFPPAAMQGSAKASISTTALSWDSYIHRYIGGTNDDLSLMGGVLSYPSSPKLLVCPADNAPPSGWNALPQSGGPVFGRRSYGMVGTSEYLQADPAVSGKPAYDLSKGTSLGVGVYWQSSRMPADWDAQSFKTSIVRDPAGTLILVEMSNSQNVAGNQWPCVALAVQSTSFAAALCQVDPNATMPTIYTTSAVNLGKFLYLNHDHRFNYLFHDGHVETLTTNATIGTALGRPTALTSPLGMWTVTVGD